MRLSKLNIVLLEFISYQKNHGHVVNVADAVKMLGGSTHYKESSYLSVYMTARRSLSKLEKEQLIVKNPSYRGRYYTPSKKGIEWLGNNKTMVKECMEWLGERIKYGRSKRT